MKKIAIIPVKHSSERVKNKNFRPFYNKLSLLEIKIIQLINSKQFDKIIISSDSEIAKEISKKYKKNVEFHYRHKKYSNNQIKWHEVITEVIRGKKIQKKDIICWCHVTSPFFKKYKNIVDKFLKLERKYDSIVAVNKFRGFLLNSNFDPVNYQFGQWHKYSQHLSKYYSVNGACFCLRKETIDKMKYLIGEKPNVLICSDLESLDLDTNLDFKVAQILFKKTLLK